MATIKKVVTLPLKLYQYCLSPFLGPHCRFHPTCSQYSIEAISEHGIFKGILLSLRRLLRCHPWCEGGVDLVPKPGEKNGL
ncbi:MAG: membrane protein insertion efficiency factor YidD [Gammaproteobacteria bacterium]